MTRYMIKETPYGSFHVYRRTWYCPIWFWIRSGYDRLHAEQRIADDIAERQPKKKYFYDKDGNQVESA